MRNDMNPLVGRSLFGGTLIEETVLGTTSGNLNPENDVDVTRGQDRTMFSYVPASGCPHPKQGQVLMVLRDDATIESAQTLLDTLRLGAYGYSGPMANFHPELYVWLCKNFDKEPEKAEWLYSFLSTASFTEQLAYPCTAKYQLDTYDGIHMAHTSRTKDVRLMTQYDKSSIDRMKHLADWFAKELGL